MIKVSVIIPVYNVEKYLRECLDSVVNQTFKDIEILLVDDGSTDNCPQICDEYVGKDDRIKVFHKQNGGYGSACNLGLENATGEYIAIVEPDDYIEFNMYEDLYKIATENNSDIVKSCFYDTLQLNEKTFCHKTKWDVEKIPQKTFNVKECSLFLSWHPSIWSCIYNHEFLKSHKIRFVEAPGAGWTDNLFQVQTMCLAERINYTDNAYYYWRRVNASVSDDLKDWRIPFIRSDEIHQWLDENNIDDLNILQNLYKREMGYIHVVLGKKEIPDMDECLSEIKRMLERMDTRALVGSKHLKVYKKMINTPLKIRQKFFSKHKLISIIQSLFKNS